MNVKEFEKKEKSTAKLIIEVTAEEFEKALQGAYLKNRYEIQIPGFRKGKATRRMIENIYGANVFYEDAVESLGPDAMKLACSEKNLDTVGDSIIVDYNVGEDKSLTIEFHVSLYPEVKLEGYTGIAAPKMSVNVTEKDVEREVNRVREQNARIEAVDRPAKEGDIVNIDFEGFVGGEAFKGGKGEGQDLELGSGTFIPGFEDQLVGRSAGEDCDVHVTFPEAYAPELAGKDATFKVHVNEVKVKELPELDDEFAKDVSEFDTLEEYMTSVKEELSARRHQEAQKGFEEVVLARLTDKVEAEIPNAMIDEHLDQMIDNFRYNLNRQGLRLEQYLSMMGMDVNTLRQDMRSTAEKQVRLDLALEHIAKVEGFTVTDEEVEKEYYRLSAEYGMKVEDVRFIVGVDSVETGLKLEKARKLVLDTAVVEETEKKDDEKTDDEAEE